MEQFSLAEYLKNPTKPIVTRDGCRARIVCTDRNHKDYPIVALVLIGCTEKMASYMENGMYLKDTPSSMDLLFAPETKTKRVGWMNVCKYGDNKHFALVGGVIHPTREQALTERPDYVVDTIQIRWEE